MIKTQTYKIYNSEKIIKKYDEQISICRMVYNLSKEIDLEHFKLEKKIGCFDLQKQLTELKQEFNFVKKVDSTVLQNTIERYFKAKDKFFADYKSGKIKKDKTNYISRCKKNNITINQNKLFNIGKPKWAKKDKYQTLNYKAGARAKSNGFYIPKFGYLKVFNFKQYQGEKIKSFSITKKIDGLYLSLQVEVELLKPINTDENQVGIDMGIKYFLVTSNGEFVENPKHLFAQLSNLRVAQRAVSRKYVINSKKQSKNYCKAQKRVAIIHKKIADCRKDFLHKTSTSLSKDYSLIIHEDLNVSGMIKSNLSKHIADVSWSTFFDLLKYKTNTIRVNPAYTSQMCNRCGHTSKENRKTQSIFECVECGFLENADKNGALNILELGVSSMKRQREAVACA